MGNLLVVFFITYCSEIKILVLEKKTEGTPLKKWATSLERHSQFSFSRYLIDTFENGELKLFSQQVIYLQKYLSLLELDYETLDYGSSTAIQKNVHLVFS